MMMNILYLLAGAAAGALIAWFWMKSKLADQLAQAKVAENDILRTKEETARRDLEIRELRENLDREKAQRITAATQLEEARKNLGEQKILLDQAQDKLSDTFKAISSDALKSNNKAFIELAQQTLENIIKDAKGDLALRQQNIQATVQPLKEALERYENGIKDMERVRQEAYGGLNKHLQSLTELQEKLQSETRNLSNALRMPQVRGSWGEVTLRRVVEVAGMCQHCDFIEQESVNTEDGRLRADLIVQLPGQRSVVVDAKVPLAAFTQAIESANENSKEQLLERHVQLVKDHVKKLGSKEYWAQFAPAPEFVVLFMPTESSFSAALEQDRTLIEQAWGKYVLLATPTTLIALLRTVAYTWQEHQLAENSKKIAEAGVELFSRFTKFAEHLKNVGERIDGLNHAFNDAVGSWDSRLVAGAKRLQELGAAAAEKELPEVKKIEAQPRQIKNLED